MIQRLRERRENPKGNKDEEPKKPLPIEENPLKAGCQLPDVQMIANMIQELLDQARSSKPFLSSELHCWLESS